jgi:hypothetical protein
VHAIVIQGNLHDRAEAKRGLDELLPRVKDAPGFVGAYFVSLDDGRALSVQVYETEEQAKAVAPPADSSAPGVTLDNIHFGEVLAAI